MKRQDIAVLTLLFLINAVNFYDRQVLSAVTEPLRLEWGLSDTQIGWLGTAFTLLYAAAGIPLGRLADTWRRKWLIALGLALWSLLTFLSGLAQGFWALFAARLGVGVGEAACAPAATSLIGDLFRPLERARAMSIFMLGLPVGLASSYVISGAIAQSHGWRGAFFVAGVPGLVLALLVLTVREPERGAADAVEIGNARRPGSPYAVLLGIPTIWVIIVSGALHNFSLYGISAFLPAFLTRYHGVTVQTAGLFSGVVIGVMGAVGMLAGGWLGDAAMRRSRSGRLWVAGIALLASAPLSWLALEQPGGSVTGFAALLGAAYALMYVYYANAYATIHDVVEPALRGSAMAVYFFVMYVMGASLGPLGTGWLSDSLSRRAAGVAAPLAIPESFRAIGLHQAMFVVPIIALLISGVLFAGALLVPRDIARLE